MDAELLEELKALRKEDALAFLRRVNWYKAHKPELYKEVLNLISVKELKDVPPDLMRAGETPGPLDISPKETKNDITESQLGFNWMLITVMLGLFLLIIVFIIIFLVS